MITRLKEIIYRTPLLKLKECKDLLSIPKGKFEKYILQRYEDPILREAIYISSPTLYKQMVKLQEQKKFFKHDQINRTKNIRKEIKKNQSAYLSLYKYLLRATYRSTPYGLYAGCGITKGTEIIYNNYGKILRKKHARLDMSVLYSIAKKLEDDRLIKFHIKYYANSSIYLVRNNYRYVTQKIEKNENQLLEIEHSIYLEQVLNKSKNGNTIYEIAKSIVNDDISYEEALIYIDTLIDEQVLVSEIQPTITNNHFFIHIINKITKIIKDIEKIKNSKLKAKRDELEKFLYGLQKIKYILKQIEKFLGCDIKLYKQIENELKKLEIKYDPSKLFKIDIENINKNINDNPNPNHKKVIDNLTRDVPDIVRLLQDIKVTELSKFKDQYCKKYENQDIPLTIALDPEIGIGFGYYLDNNTKEDHIIDTKAEKENIEYNLSIKEKENYILGKIIESIRDHRSVKIGTKDFEILQNKHKIKEHYIQIKSTFIPNESNNEMIAISYIGYTPLKMVGRFTYFSKEFKNFAKKIISSNPDTENCIEAEVVHVSENSVANIVMRPKLSKYEIPYITKSSLQQKHQIRLEDIWIRLSKNYELILYSKKLNKRIIPRMSTMQNFMQKGNLPIYQFLCALEYQNQKNISFIWDPLKNILKYTPRIEYKNIILSPATWQFTQKDYSEISDVATLDIFLKKHKIPKYILVCESDNIIPVDSTNEISKKILLHNFKKPKLCIRESLINFDKLGKNQNYNQEIIFNYKNKSFKKNKNFKIGMANNIQREFCLGTEWIYYKIYAGQKIINDILIQIADNVKELQEMGIVNKWFFLRYHDPEYHIRIRYHLTDTKYISKVIANIKNIIQPLILSKVVNKIEYDTYKREIEKYGNETMELAEDIFYLNSQEVIHYYKKSNIDKELWAICYIDNLLDIFNYQNQEKLSILQAMSQGMIKTFEIDKETIIKLNLEYRKYKLTILEQTREKYSDTKQEFICKEDLFLLYKNHLLVRKKVEFSYVQELIHMFCNRFFITNQRKNETKVYYLLYKHYAQISNKCYNTQLKLEKLSEKI